MLLVCVDVLTTAAESTGCFDRQPSKIDRPHRRRARGKRGRTEGAVENRIPSDCFCFRIRRVLARLPLRLTTSNRFWLNGRCLPHCPASLLVRCLGPYQTSTFQASAPSEICRGGSEVTARSDAPELQVGPTAASLSRHGSHIPPVYIRRHPRIALSARGGQSCPHMPLIGSFLFRPFPPESRSPRPQQHSAAPRIPSQHTLGRTGCCSPGRSLRQLMAAVTRSLPRSPNHVPIYLPCTHPVYPLTR